ncbi:hypothetical protein HN51_031501, partial [Arachis hypogaea]
VAPPSPSPSLVAPPSATLSVRSTVSRGLLLEKKSKAAGLRETANHLRDLNLEDAHEILRQAAEIFEGIGIINIAAQCFLDLGDHEKTGINLKFSFYIYACHL